MIRLIVQLEAHFTDQGPQSRDCFWVGPFAMSLRPWNVGVGVPIDPSRHADQNKY